MRAAEAADEKRAMIAVFRGSPIEIDRILLDVLIETAPFDGCVMSAFHVRSRVTASVSALFQFVESEWRPIATAPKEGGPVAVYGEYVGDVSRFQPMLWLPCERPQVEGRFVMREGGGGNVVRAKRAEGVSR